jgi:ATP-dependent Lon protease
LQNTTLFPETMVPLSVGRPGSMAAVEAALSSEEKLIACISVRPERMGEGDPKPDDLYEIGTLVQINRMERVEGTLHLIVQGIDRVQLMAWEQAEPHLRGRVRVLPELQVEDKEKVEATKRNVQSLIQQALAYLPQVPPEVRLMVLGADDPVRLAYFLGSILSLGVEKEQQMLEANSVDELVHLAHDFLAREVEIIRLRSKIATEAQTEMDKAQRDYVLRQQMKAIQKELGEDESGEQAEATQLRERLAKAELPDDVRKEAERELNRMEKLPAMAPDYHVIRTYLDFILELPWMKSSEDRLDLNEAQKVLDEDHYDIQDIKERILEFLAVIKLKPNAKSPILWFSRPAWSRQDFARAIDRARHGPSLRTA